MTELVIYGQWYQELIDECQDILVESEFSARWTLIEAYHAVGKMILGNENNFTERGYTHNGITQRISSDLNRSQRTIQQSIQFARMYPDLNLLPEGKNTSWHQICKKYLPAPSGKPKKQKEEYLNCLQCGSEIMPIKITCNHCSREFELKKDMIKRR